MKFLVTGAAGFIGMHTCLALLKKYETPLVNLGPRRLRSESACISAIITASNIIEG